jgi:hypothetical protein
VNNIVNAETRFLDFSTSYFFSSFSCRSPYHNALIKAMHEKTIIAKSVKHDRFKGDYVPGLSRSKYIWK